MLRRFGLLALSVIALACWGGAPLVAQQTEQRIALVIGNAGYGPGALPTALNDAGLVAEALRSIGFEIVEGADLSQAEMVRSVRDFLAKVNASGPDALAFVYFSGHALSFDGESFLLGVDARLERESDIPIEAVRLSDLLGPFADSPARAKVVMIDAARPLPFRPQGKGLARGLESIEPAQGMLVAYSSAPGTVAPDRPGDYGAYATAIAEMLRAPDIDLEAVFTHIRSRTHQSTDGQQTPWHNSALSEPIELVPPQAATTAASVPPPPPPRERRAMRDIGPDEAYGLAIEMDTLDGYVAFVDAYPRHAYSERIWATIRARREALAWMRALDINTPQAYWTYLRRYPDGMYAFDAERRLRRLRAQFAPPPGFAMLEFDGVPMALRDEPRDYRDVYRVGPPPPRNLFRGQRPAFLVNLPPPRRGAGRRSLPALSVAVPVVPLLAPAPRRGGRAPGAGRSGGGPGSRGGSAGRTPAPASVTPNTTIAPSTVSPSPGVESSRPGGGRPPGSGLRPGSLAPSGAANRGPGSSAPLTATPGTATSNPAVAPSAVTPSSGGATPPPGRRRPPVEAGRPPGAAPPPGTASRTPPLAPGAATHAPGTPRPPVAARPSGVPPPVVRRPAPPAAVARPTPQPAARPAPAAKPPAPPSPRVAAPPPRPAAPPAARPKAAPKPAAAAPKPPACPAGKTLKNVGGKPVCA